MENGEFEWRMEDLRMEIHSVLWDHSDELVLSDNPSIVEADLDLLKQAASCVTITV